MFTCTVVLFSCSHVLLTVPSSIQVIQDQTVTEGDKVTLSCNVSGVPPPMVSWIRPNGQRVDTNVLEFINIMRNEAGEYRCEASNECGNPSQAASIDVQCMFVLFYCEVTLV